MPDSKPAATDHSDTLLWGCIIAAVIVLATAIGFAIAAIPETGNWNESGTRGDWFGGHIASGGSLAGSLLFFAALWLQRRDLQLQREELTRTREEMAEARKVHDAQRVQLEEQSRLARKQIVVQGIFEILKLRDQAAYEYEKTRTGPMRRY
jgi:hypothetical protein